MNALGSVTISVRTLRRKKQFPEALKYGREALRIGEDLGDLRLVATNRVNLGNVYRDMGESEAAIAQYAAGGDFARKSGDKSLESSATRLSAGIYRKQGKITLALEHAILSASLVEARWPLLLSLMRSKRLGIAITPQGNGSGRGVF